MDVKSALDAMDVSAEAFLLLPPGLKRNAAVQSFAFGKRASLALEVDLTGKDLESAILRAVRKGLTLKEVAKKNPFYASNLPCILAALTRDPSEMRFANLRVAASTLDAQQQLQLRNKVQECVLKDGNTLLFAEQFRGDTLIVLSACVQDVRHAALATEPLGTQLCRIEVDRPGNLVKIANILLQRSQTKKRKLFPFETCSPNLSLLPPCLVEQPQQKPQNQVAHNTQHESAKPSNNQVARPSDVQKAKAIHMQSDVRVDQSDVQESKPSDVQESNPSDVQSDVRVDQPSDVQKAKTSHTQSDDHPSGVQGGKPSDTQ